MRLPGATRSGLATRSRAVGPRDEYVVVVSSESSGVPWSFIAPTVITLRELQGLVIVTYPLRPPFPAEQTTTTPASQRASTAWTRGSTAAGSYTGWPIERLTTRIPYWVLLSRVHWRPAITSEVRPRPVPSSTRTETRFACGATPAMRPSGEWRPLP